MDAPVTNEVEDRIAAKIAGGRYETREQVLCAALNVLDAWDSNEIEKLVRLRGSIREGLDSGPPIPVDATYWLSVKSRGRDRIENARKSSRETIR